MYGGVRTLTLRIVGAKMTTLRKYEDAYRKLYPSSAQIVVRVDPLRYWKPKSAQVNAFCYST